MKTSEVSITSNRSVDEIGVALRGALAQVKAQSVDDIEHDTSSLGRYEERAEIEIVAQGSTMLTGLWAVQVYVSDHGLSRSITLVALGDSGFSKAMNGAKNSTWLSTSVKKRDAIGNLLG